MKTELFLQISKPSAKNLKQVRRLLYLCGFVCFFACSDFLDVVPENAATMEHAFANRNEALNSLYGCFSYLPAMGTVQGNLTLLGGDETWYIRDPMSASSIMWTLALNEQNVVAPIANFWSSRQKGDANGGKYLFSGLSDCNIFLEKVGEAYDLTEEEKKVWVAQVKFLKAYLHFYLFRMYGPIPIIKENQPLNAKGQQVNLYRNTVDEVVNYIVELLDESYKDLPTVIEDLNQDLGLPSQVINLALKAEVLTYAASPLFNGNTDYAGFKDNRGINLFPQTYDPLKWRKAAEALKAAIDFAEANKYRLYDFGDASQYAANLNEKTILAMQVRGAVTDPWNTELIWGDSNTNTQQLQQVCHPWLQSGNDYGSATFRLFAPTQKTVEQFYTKNGIPIEDDEEWVNVDPFGTRVATADDRWYISEGYKTINLYFDREPRFYGSICFDGGVFYGNGRMQQDNTTNHNYSWVSYMRAQGIDGAGYGGSVGTGGNRYSSTGYLCKKLISYLSSTNTSGGFTNMRYPFPIIRLADLYLMYAEALNETEASPTPEVYKYIDLVRKRTGLEGVVQSWNDHAIDGKKNKPATKDGMRDIIRRERLNELAFEGIRYWDLRRWKIAEDVYTQQPVQGLDIRGTTFDEFYTLKTLFQQKFSLKDYFFPIKESTLLLNSNLVQNPGWD
ncbi:MAG: RagB/SusD family nutrient uptake outer membrane protein [Prevotellaceae bacterium]|nr:RagB/SusD family nutrient uptake outer membrane protein [Prevotellaceae bacterium]